MNRNVAHITKDDHDPDKRITRVMLCGLKFRTKTGRRRRDVCGPCGDALLAEANRRAQGATYIWRASASGANEAWAS